MKKKRLPGSRQSVSNPGPHETVLKCPNVQEHDLRLYARSFHMAAKKLAGHIK
jgi:hypothetical protein